jgi:hypothetical protein
VTAAEFDGLLNAHAYLRVERPPAPWTPASDLEPFTRMLGEMIATGLVRNGGILEELTLNVSNVVVEAEAADPFPEGKFVAVTIRGSGAWGSDRSLEAVQQGATAAGSSYLYSRMLSEDEGSVTVLMPVQHSA